jgi:hypothetical protein
MRDRAATQVRIGRYNHIAGAHRVLVVTHHFRDVAAELPHHHASIRIGNHRKFVVLFAYDRTHRRAEKHSVHLEACILQRVLDNIECNRIYLDLRNLGYLDI